jgi:hypothetical protein
LQVSRVVVVFDDYRDPVQRPAARTRPTLRIACVGFGERIAVDDADRVQCRPVLVVRLDAREILRH